MLDRRRIGYPTLLLVGLVVAVALGIVAGGATSSAAFGAYNPGWEGGSALRGQADAVGADSTVALNVSAYERASPNGTVALVLSPDESYGPDDRRRVRRFVDRGGTLVVADDYGAGGNRLLDAAGATARVDGRPLRDEREYYRSPALPVAPNVSDAPLTAGVDRLTLNHGSVVRRGNATVLVRTSAFAYLDGNGNAELDDDERVASYPVATTERVGRGRVIVVSDASLFINTMVERPGNGRFVRNLFAANERVLLDYSHSTTQPPLVLALLHLRRTPVLQALVGAVGLGLVGAWSRRDRRRGRSDDGDATPASRSDDDALVSYLRERHPTWSESRLRRVVSGVAFRRERDRDDE